MVKSNEVFLAKMVALCFALSVVLFEPKGVAASMDLEESPGPVAIDYDTSTISPDSDPFDVDLPPGVGECAEMLNKECAREIYLGVMYQETVTRTCCTQLVAMGRECHEILVETILDNNPEIKPIAPMILLRSERVWHECDSDAESPF